MGVLLQTVMPTATVPHHLVTTMTVGHPRGTTTIATAAVAAAEEEEVDITRRGPTTEGVALTATLAEEPKGTTVLETLTGMIGMVEAQAMEQDGHAPPAHSTGIPGQGGITEAEAGAMRGRQGLLCPQDRLWLQDTKTGKPPKNAFLRNRMNHIAG